MNERKASENNAIKSIAINSSLINELANEVAVKIIAFLNRIFSRKKKNIEEGV